MAQGFFIVGQDQVKKNPMGTTLMLGGKGMSLVEMDQMGFTVPPAIIIPTTACDLYQQDPKAAMSVIKEQLPQIKAYFEGKFGYMPLVSVRSGAPVSMPGMMDTILNVGLNYGNRAVWASRRGEQCADDSYARLQEMYKDVVGEEVPSDVDEQILGAIQAVFKSWNNTRAVEYRTHKGIPHNLGTAVVIQAMVFGNRNDKSCSGVLESRDTSTGENIIRSGDFVIGGQGEDVVAGKKQTISILKLPEWNFAVAKELSEGVEKLEKYKRDAVEVEFTVEDGVLYWLQVRVVQRTAQAALQIAVDLVDEGIISAQEAVSRVKLDEFLNAAKCMIAPSWKIASAVKGIPASAGVVKAVAMSPKDAVNCTVDFILVAEQTDPDDYAMMVKAKGVLTRKGGLTSHAAVVVRGMNKPCVVGCSDLPLLRPGLLVTIDGSTGDVWLGNDVPLVDNTNLPCVAKFKALVASAYEFMPIVESVAQLPVNGGFFASSGIDSISTSEMKVVFNAVVEKMQSGVIDLTTEYSQAAKVDQDFLGAFGIGEEANAEVVSSKVIALSLVGAQGKNDIWVYGVNSNNQAETLESEGFKVIPKIETLEQLVMAEKYGVISAKAGKAFMRLLALKAKAGEPFAAMVVTNAAEKAMFVPGVRVATTELAAVQSLIGR